MNLPAYTATAWIGNLIASPVAAVATLGTTEAIGAALTLTVALAGLVAIRLAGRTSVADVPTELDYREAA